MKKQIISVVALSGVVAFVALNFGGKITNGQSFLQVDSVDSAFARYLARYGKSYHSVEEYNLRRALFEKQLNRITEVNSRNDISYTVGLNKFSDLTDAEFERYLGDSREPEDYSLTENSTQVTL